MGASGWAVLGWTALLSMCVRQIRLFKLPRVVGSLCRNIGRVCQVAGYGSSFRLVGLCLANSIEPFHWSSDPSNAVTGFTM